MSDDSHTLLPLRHTTSLRSFRRYCYDGECYGNLAWRVFSRGLYDAYCPVAICYSLAKTYCIAVAAHELDGDIHIIANYAKHATNRELIGEICAGVPYDAFLCSIDVCMNNYELWIDFSINDAILARKYFLVDRDLTTYSFKRTRESRDIFNFQYLFWQYKILHYYRSFITRFIQRERN